MYLIAALALIFYVSKVPERYFPGETLEVLFSEVCVCVSEGSLSEPLTSRGVSLQASSTTWAPATRCGTCCWC